VTLGIFLMGWSSEEGILKFQQLAQSTFHQPESRFPMLRSAQRLAWSYLRDGQYSSSEIERAFRTDSGEDISMFNPLSNDTKVAVTATTAKNPRACLLTNYNRGFRSDDNGQSGKTVSRSMLIQFRLRHCEGAEVQARHICSPSVSS